MKQNHLFEIVFYTGCGSICGSMVGGIFGERTLGLWVGAAAMLVFELYTRFYKR